MGFRSRFIGVVPFFLRTRTIPRCQNINITIAPTLELVISVMILVPPKIWYRYKSNNITHFTNIFAVYTYSQPDYKTSGHLVRPGILLAI